MTPTGGGDSIRLSCSPPRCQSDVLRHLSAW
jgi:hypothetical protein